MSAGSAGLGTSMAGVEVASTHRLGDYDAAVLRAEGSDALHDWLTAAGLKGLDAADRAVVDDYIAREWCFVVARLRKDIATATPHPIAATFPAPQPIYPMKLTGLAGSTTRVALFVVAESQASAEDFDCLAADQYAPAPAEDELGPGYRADEIGLVVGHPDACSLMWPDCVVTALTAALTPEQMDRDVTLSMGPLTAEREWVFSLVARRDLVGAILTVGLGLVLLVTTVACAGRRAPARPAAVTIVAMSAVVFIAAALTGLLLPTIPVRMSRAPSWRMSEMARACANGTTDALAEGSIDEKLLRDNPEKLIETLLAGGLTQAPNYIVGGQMRAERSPGNYWVRYIDDRPYFCLYDGDGREISFRIRIR